jgi:hypothetical protein
MASMFKKPVTSEHYLSVISQPMALETVRGKLKDGLYFSYRDWLADLELMYENAIKYNGADSVMGGIALYLKKKWEKMADRLGCLNHQNYEERIRALYCEIAYLTGQVGTQTEILATPKYEVKDLMNILNKLSDTAEVEKVIKQGGDQRVLKKSKNGVLNLDQLSRKTLDELWFRFCPNRV